MKFLKLKDQSGQSETSSSRLLAEKVSGLLIHLLSFHWPPLCEALLEAEASCVTASANFPKTNSGVKLGAVGAPAGAEAAAEAAPGLSPPP